MEYRRDAIFVEMGQSIQDMSGVQMLFPFLQCFLYGTCVVIINLPVPKSPFNVRLILRMAFAINCIIQIPVSK